MFVFVAKSQKTANKQDIPCNFVLFFLVLSICCTYLHCLHTHIHTIHTFDIHVAISPSAEPTRNEKFTLGYNVSYPFVETISSSTNDNNNINDGNVGSSNDENEDDEDDDNDKNNDMGLVLAQILILLFCFCITICFVYYIIIYRRNGGSFTERRYSVKNNTVTVVINSQDSRSSRYSQHSRFSVSNAQSQHSQHSQHSRSRASLHANSIDTNSVAIGGSVSVTNHDNNNVAAHDEQLPRMQRLFTASAGSLDDNNESNDNNINHDEDQDSIHAMKIHYRQNTLVLKGEHMNKKNNNDEKKKNGEDDATTIVNETEGPDWTDSSESGNQITEGVFVSQSNTYGRVHSSSVRVEVVDGGFK